MSEKTKSFDSQKKFLEDDKVWKLILKLCLPTIIMFLAVAIYGVSDTIMATVLTEGTYKSDQTAISAMGYAISYLAILQSFLVIINVGSVIKYSSLISQDKHSEAKEFVGSSLSGTFIINAAVSTVGILLAEPVLTLMAGSNAYDEFGQLTEAVNASVDYINIAGITILFIGFYDLLIRYIRTDGNPNVAGIIGISGIPFNLLFNWVFMGAMGMGIEGGAIASVIGYGFTLITAISFSLYQSKKSSYSIIFTSWKNLIPKWQHLSLALLFGVPAFVRNILMTLNNFTFAAFTNSISPPDFGSGPDPEFFSVSSGIYSQLTNLISSMIRGITQGSVVFLSYNYTKKNYDKVREGIKWMSIYMFILVIFISAIIFPLVPSLCNVLSSGESVIYGNDIYYVVYAMISSTLVFAILLILFAFYNSTKQVRNSIIASVINSVIVFFTVIPLMMVFGSWQAAVWSLTISYLISSLIIAPITIWLIKNMHLTEKGAKFKKEKRA